MFNNFSISDIKKYCTKKIELNNDPKSVKNQIEKISNEMKQMNMYIKIL